MVTQVARRNTRRLGLVTPGVRRDGRYRVTVHGSVELDSTVTVVDEALTDDATIILALVADGGPTVVHATHTASGECFTDVTIDRDAMGRWRELTEAVDCVRLG